MKDIFEFLVIFPKNGSIYVRIFDEVWPDRSIFLLFRKHWAQDFLTFEQSTLMFESFHTHMEMMIGASESKLKLSSNIL